MVRHAFLATLLGAALFLAGPTGSGPETARAQGCLSQGDTRAAVASGEAASLSRFVGDLRQLGQVVSSRLCSRNGRLVYEVSVVSGNGNVQTVLLDARSGARLN